MGDSDVVIGIDVGTSAVKAVAVDQFGHELFSYAHRIFTDVVRPGWNEQDPKEWWEASCKVLKKVTLNVKPENIRAVGLSGQMHSPALLDKHEDIVRPSILWNDGRTSNQCETIYELLGVPKVKNIIGNPILEGFTAPKLLWLKQHEENNFGRLESFMIAKDYIGFMLTGEKFTEPSDASGTVLMDINSQDWSMDVIGQLGLQHLTLPTIKKSIEVTGTVSREASVVTGLLMGTPVVAGGADNAASAISTGSIHDNVCQISLGTSGTVLQTTTSPVIDDGLRLHAFSHCVQDRWYSMGVTLSAASSFAWFADNVIGVSNGYKVLDEEADAIGPGSGGLIFLPYLNGERTPHNDPDIRGAFLRLDASHSRAHMIRSIMEGVAFSIREVLELMETLINPADVFVITGGGANSKVWAQILSDVLGENISRVVSNSGPSYGAALLSAVGVGWYKTLEDGVNEWVVLSDYVATENKSRELYEDSFIYYKRAYSRLR